MPYLTRAQIQHYCVAIAAILTAFILIEFFPNTDKSTFLIFSGVVIISVWYAAARAAELQNIRVLESITDGFLTLDRNWRFTYINQRGSELLGSTFNELRGKCLWDVYPVMLGSVFEQHYRRVMAEKVSVCFEAQVVNGSGRWYELHVYPFGDGLSIYFQNISDRVCIEAEREQTAIALQQSEARFRRIFESNMIGMNFATFDGEVILANEAYLNLVGYSSEDVTHRRLNWRSLTPIEYSVREAQAAAEIRHHGTCTPYEKELIRKDGSRIPVIVGAATIDDTSHGYMCFVLDVSDRKRLEADLRQQSAALEEANRAKDQFLAIVSHELRTPLNAILGWATLLQQRKFNEQTTQRALAAIERNALIQTQVVDDLLDITCILQKQLRISRCPIHVVAPLEAAIESLRSTAHEKEIKIRVTIVDPITASMRPVSFDLDEQPLTLKFNAQDVPFRVSADAKRLQQILWNLLSNAIKFTAEGGQIEVRLERIDLDLANSPETAQSAIRIQVVDSGIGLSSDFIPHVFDPFYQADSTLARPFGGLGLGLAIARHLVELHGGTVHADSPGEGQGATFTIELPLLEPLPFDRQEKSVEMNQIAKLDTSFQKADRV
jgi:PAS domain S-box-containing protein